MFHEYLKEINHKFLPEKYNLLENNCNHFTNDVCEFLVGEGIPKYVLNQADEILNSPMGQMFKPMLTQMQGNIQNQTHGSFQ